MSVVLIGTAVASAVAGWTAATFCWVFHKRPAICRMFGFASMALIIAALFLAYVAGAQA